MPDPDAFNAIADSTRRLLLERLREGAKTVNELAEGMPMSRPAISQHLKVLLDAGVVSASSQGTRRYYKLEADGLLGPNLWLDQFWDA